MPFKKKVPGVYYKQVLDPLIGAILKGDPEALIILRIGCPTSDEFIREYPDDLTKFNDGKIAHYTNPAVGNPAGRYSFASTQWERYYAQALLELINHIRKANYSKHVIGYFPTAGAYGQWLYWMDYNRHNYALGFSQAMRCSFKNYLKRKYGTNAGLQKAWNDPQVNFDTAAIPQKSEREQYDFGYFRNPATQQKTMDYYACLNREVGKRIIYLSRVIKKATGGKALVGYFYGALGCINYLSGGHSVFKQVLASPYVDFLSNPPGYENRGVGNDAPFPFVTASTKLHGKLWISEADTRTCFSGPKQITCGAPENLQDSLAVLKRDFARIICAGVNGWWFEMRPGWYDHPDILRLFSQMQNIGALSCKLERSSNCRIAVIADQESLLVCSSLFLSKQILDRERVNELGRIGCMYDFFETDDIAKLDLGKYKLFIFLNAFSLSSAERDQLSRLLKRDNKVLLWVYAPGLINPDSCPQLSLANMESLTGMKFGYLKTRCGMDMKITNYNHSLTRKLVPSCTFGSHTRLITTDACGATPEKPRRLKPLAAKPQFFVDDKEAITLARFLDSGKPGYAIKKFPGWTSVYVGSACIPANVLREVARFAGVHLYLEEDEIVYHNRSFLAVHTNTEAKRTIKLPARSDVYDLFENKLIAEQVKEFSIFIPAKKTKLFYVGNIKKLRK
ncbi:MAG: hypothetical protein WC082_01625 [Victivallales bacterium]